MEQQMSLHAGGKRRRPASYPGLTFSGKFCAKMRLKSCSKEFFTSSVCSIPITAFFIFEATEPASFDMGLTRAIKAHPYELKCRFSNRPT
jgi:hypothetical protein